MCFKYFLQKFTVHHGPRVKKQRSTGFQVAVHHGPRSLVRQKKLLLAMRQPLRRRKTLLGAPVGSRSAVSSASHGGPWGGSPWTAGFSHVGRGGPQAGIPWTVVFHMWTVVGRTLESRGPLFFHAWTVVDRKSGFRGPLFFHAWTVVDRSFFFKV